MSTVVSRPPAEDNKIPAPSTSPVTSRRSRHSSTNAAAIALFSLASVGALLTLVPFYLMLVMSLKTPAEIAENPWALPHVPQWINYVNTWTIEGTGVTFSAFFANTLLIATLSTIGTLLSSSVVAFGFARLRFPGRDRLFVLLLATMMLPGIVTMIPQYIGFSRVHWIDTFYPLIVPAFFGGAFNVFLLRQFLLTMPRELDEAALLDGATYFQIYWKILMPLCKPALVTVGLFAFIYAWKDLMGPLIYMNSTSHQTRELGLRTFQTIHGTDWNLLMAGSVIVLIPLLVMFFFGQRYFIQGIVMSGLKD